MESSACFQPVKLESNTVCYGCLSSGRVLKPLQANFLIIFSLLNQQQRSPEHENAIMLFCWECMANLRNIKKFQNRILNAQWILRQSQYALKQSTSSLSTLSVAILNTQITLKHEETTHVTDDIKVVIKELSMKDSICEKIKEENIECDSELKIELTQCSTDAEFNDDVDVKEEFPVERKREKSADGRKYGRVKRVKVTKNADVDLNKPENNYSFIYLNAKEMEDLLKRDSRGAKKSRHNCKRCKSTFKLSKDLKRHKTFQHTQVSESGPYICLECGADVGTRSELHAHWDRHNYVLKCNVCGARKRHEVAMLRHIACHQNLYTCVDCRMQFCSIRDFNRHYQELHKLLICDYCGHRASNKDTLLKHMKCNHLPATCVECQKTFVKYKSLHAHKKSQHPHLASEPVDPSLSYCVECDKQYGTVDKYKQHVSRSHTPKEKVSVPCPDCGRVFSRKIHMNNHYKLFHAGNSKHYCSSCDKYFVTAFTALKHQRAVHQKIALPKNKMCDICGRGFSTNRILTHHRRTHTGERPHQCPHCAAAFAQKYALTTHLRTQHKHAINS